MSASIRRTLAVLFFVSGFSGLIYQVVWVRMAFAAFGVIAPVLSVVLSVFMLGLAVGSWAAGRLVGPVVARTGLSAALFYAAAEALIGGGAFAVPPAFAAGNRALLSAGRMDSAAYLALSGLVLAAAIFPWCLCMGATFPLMLAHLRERDERRSDGFSFLYLANVLGGMAGTLLTAVVLIELLGFRHTLWVAAAGNAVVAVAAVVLGLTRPTRSVPTVDDPDALAAATAAEAGGAATLSSPDARSDRSTLGVLFATGFLSMAMEVVWSRGFAGVLKTQVYSFALILFTYLGATFAGSAVYRWDARAGRRRPRATLYLGLAVAALLPVFVNDPEVTLQDCTNPNLHVPSAIGLLASICPLCAVLGYLTPQLVDAYAAGHPRRAGSAYAANVVGCILGPLLAGYGLLPRVSGRWSLIGLALPFAALWIFARRDPARPASGRVLGGVVLAAAVAVAVFYSRDFEERALQQRPAPIVRRDYIASVVAVPPRPAVKPAGNPQLIVNGFGMTTLTPITKFIAHLPLVAHAGQGNAGRGGPPPSVLVVCFGMGTTFRSSLTWAADVTAVDLVPSVPADFGVFFADAAAVRADPRGHVVVDDGRRYLARCGRLFDVITVDPPPPVEAAGSSLLFSAEFYELAKRHLKPHGVVQMWCPVADRRTLAAITGSMVDAFPHVRCFVSVEGWGVHLLGSMDAVDLPPTAAAAVARMPPAARRDLTEWSPSATPAELMGVLLGREVPPSALLAADPAARVTDDRPFNEYYLLRRLTERGR